ncbi:MAG TPA: SUMF1/EgtB/PvdO family nonheme iron enzyme, partial [Xanthobacteraceae bacterium]|nr:SUMF1/EgtB/PvdO family nonheme iron enzyme [Xanthobacteraceae bacterium]
TVVVLWTPRSINSEWVRTEAHYGQDRGKLIPVMLENCSIPLAFMLRQTVKLCDWAGDRGDRDWRKLLTWIADLTSTKPGNANIPQALGAAQPNPFRDAIGRLPSGDPIVDGAFVNAATPAGTAFRDGERRPVMRILPKGAFLLGSPATDPDRTAVEGPQKRVEIPTPFAIGAFPVLVSEYEAVMGALPSVTAVPAASRGLLGVFQRPAALALAPVASNPSAPVTSVSYDDAQAFLARLSAATGETYRIPSETEWEYACRAGSHGRYSFGDTIDATQAAFAAQSGPIAPGSFPPNAFGVYDMHGNVREWTGDLWHESYDTTPADGSAATQGHGSMRVVRGGGWCDGPAMLRSAARMRATQSSRSNAIGFRVVRVLS